MQLLLKDDGFEPEPSDELNPKVLKRVSSERIDQRFE